MTKYLQSIISRFEELKQGMRLNKEKWMKMPESINTIDNHIEEIKRMDLEIENIKEELSKKQSEARKLRDLKRSRIEIIEKRAIGLHADEEEKLELYKIKKKGGNYKFRTVSSKIYLKGS